MKKIFLLLAVVGMTLTQSCEGDPGPQGPTGYSAEAEVFEIRNVNFVNDGSGFYGIVYGLNPSILASDMILVYRQSGSFNGNPIWESLPKTYYFSNGEELDVNFDFTMNDISIYLDYTDPSVLTADFVQNQLFRVVIVPGYLSNKMSSTKYDDVKKELNIDESDFAKSIRK
ncbi:MAG TPA: hypothetical protein VK528_02545 [Flavobacterium sp.]|nr:hypothetical protein [Flavobacterium sp.]